MRPRPWFCFFALLTGCPSFQPTSDGGPGTQVLVDTLVTPPIAPAAPSPVQMTPCAAGWREAAGTIAGDATTCEPWPEEGVTTCGPDSAHFPGQPGCSRIGAACPTGLWPEALPATGSVLYVNAAAGPGGAGTMSAPFKTITSALAASHPGTIVALAKGTYDETMQVPTAVTLWGACVAQTHVQRSVASTSPTIYVAGAGVTLRNFHIGGPRPGVRVDGIGATLDLQDMVISGGQVLGLVAVAGAHVTGSHVAIRGVQPRIGVNDIGDGLVLDTGAQADLSWVALDGNHSAGAAVYGVGTLLKLTDAVVRDTQSEVSSGAYGQGLTAINHGRIEATRVVVEGSHMAGVSAEFGGIVVLADAVVRDTQASPSDPNNGVGLWASTDGGLELRRVLVARNRANGLELNNVSAKLIDVVVRDTQPQAVSLKSGSGILVTGTVTGQRIALEGNCGAAVDAEFAGTSVSLQDVVIRRTDGSPGDGQDGQGLVALRGAALSITRGLIEGSRCAGIVASEPATSITLEDVTVRNTRGCLSDNLDGQGVIAQFGASLVGTRILVESNRGAGVLAGKENTSVMLTDALIRDTHGEEGTGTTGGAFGEGLHAQEGALMTLRRVRVERSHEVGLFVVTARVVGTDVEIRETQESECPKERCSARGGFGAVASDDGSIALSRFSLSTNALAGMSLTQGGTADLVDGEVVDNPIGINVETPGFDLGRIQGGVVFRGNTANLGSNKVPLPPLPSLTRVSR